MADIKLASAHMPLLERLRKGANCVVFLDGAPGPAADVADMLRKAADEIEALRAALKTLWVAFQDDDAFRRVYASLNIQQPIGGE